MPHLRTVREVGIRKSLRARPTLLAGTFPGYGGVSGSASMSAVVAQPAAVMEMNWSFSCG